MKTSATLFALFALFALAACDAPLEADPSALVALSEAQVETLEVTLAEHEIARESDPAAALPELDIDMSEAEPPSEEAYGCDAALIAEYCFGLTGHLFYSGQCLGQNELVSGWCILVDPSFGPCYMDATPCNGI